MGRKISDKVEYFPHDTKWGRSITILDGRYGNDGHSSWNKILELLGDTEGFFLNCNDPTMWEYLLARCHVNAQRMEEMLDLMTALQMIDGELWLSRIIWSQNFVDRLKEVYVKRGRPLPQRPTPEEITGPKTAKPGTITTVKADNRPNNNSGTELSSQAESKMPQSTVQDRTAEDSTDSAKRVHAVDKKTLESLEFVLRLHDDEFAIFDREIKQMILDENKTRGNGRFTWPHDTGGITSDLRKLIYQVTDDKKRSILQNLYTINGQIINWPNHVKNCIALVLRMSRKKAIHKPYNFIRAELLENPARVATEMSEGVGKDLANYLRK